MINRMGSFVKTKDCPASESLLAFMAGRAKLNEVIVIERHLWSCEFCAAEVDLYRNFPPVEEGVIAPGPIPEPLRQLAEALLTKRSDLSPLNKLLID